MRSSEEEEWASQNLYKYTNSQASVIREVSPTQWQIIVPIQAPSGRVLILGSCSLHCESSIILVTFYRSIWALTVSTELPACKPGYGLWHIVLPHYRANFW
jgi:hypothetical protein